MDEGIKWEHSTSEIHCWRPPSAFIGSTQAVLLAVAPVNEFSQKNGMWNYEFEIRFAGGQGLDFAYGAFSLQLTIRIARVFDPLVLIKFAKQSKFRWPIRGDQPHGRGSLD